MSEPKLLFEDGIETDGITPYRAVRLHIYEDTAQLLFFKEWKEGLTEMPHDKAVEVYNGLGSSALTFKKDDKLITLNNISIETLGLIMMLLFDHADEIDPILCDYFDKKRKQIEESK